MEQSTLKISLATVSCMEKLSANGSPAYPENTGVALRCQKHRFQLAIRNMQAWALYNVRILVTGDVASSVSIFTIDSVPAQNIFIGKTDDYYLEDSGAYPDVIRPLLPGDVILPPNGNRCLWVTVEGDIPVGVHKIGFDVFDAENKLMGSAEYSLEVVSARIERAPIKKTNWMHYDCIAASHGVKLFTAEFYAVFENYLAAFTRSGFNMLYTPLFTPPLDTYIGGERSTAQLVGVNLVGGRYSFDFSLLKEFILFARARGIEYIEFSHLFTQWGGEHCPKIVATVDGEVKKIFGWEDDSLGDRYVSFLSAFLPELVAFIKNEGICDIVLFHLTDEPNEKHIERYEKLNSLVKKYIGDLPTIDTLSNYEFYKKGLMDYSVPEISHIDEFVENGAKNMLAYYCCEPSDRYYTNRFLNMPLQRMRILGLQLYLSGAQGFLHWGFNFYNSGLSYRTINPYEDTNAGGAFPPGDGFIVYPRAGGVNLSLRSEMMGILFEDYDILFMLEKSLGREKVLDILRGEGLSGFTDYPHSASWHTQFINRLKKEL